MTGVRFLAIALYQLGGGRWQCVGRDLMLATRLFILTKVEKHWRVTSTRRRKLHIYLNVSALSNVQTAILNATQQQFSVFYDSVTKEIAVTADQCHRPDRLLCAHAQCTVL
jgi:hypothetical protein